MKTIYVADDGKQFEDEFECMDYEWKMKHKGLERVQMYDGNGNKLTELFSEDTYGEAMKIVVPDEESVHDLQELASYTGYCCYGDVDAPGEWIWKDDGTNGHFVLKELESVGKC